MFTHGLILEESKQCVLSAIHLVLLEGNGIFVDIWQYVCYFFFCRYCVRSCSFLPEVRPSLSFLRRFLAQDWVMLGHVSSVSPPFYKSHSLWRLFVSCSFYLFCNVYELARLWEAVRRGGGKYFFRFDSKLSNIFPSDSEMMYFSWLIEYAVNSLCR